MQLVSNLSKLDCPARPIVLMNTLQVKRNGVDYEVSGVNRSALDWCLSSSRQHVPVVASLAETYHGQIVSLPTSLATQEIAATLQPMKVNHFGGIFSTGSEAGSNRSFSLSPWEVSEM